MIKQLFFVCVHVCADRYAWLFFRGQVFACSSEKTPAKSLQANLLGQGQTWTSPEKLFRSRLKTEGKWPKREHLTTLQRWSAVEAEHRNPAFHIKLKIKAWELFKGCSFVCVTVLRKAQTKISFFSSFFLQAQLAACQHGGCRPVPDWEYTLAFCCQSSLCFCFYLRETTRFISSVLGAGVVANARNTVVHRKLTWMLAFPLLYHQQLVSSLTFDLPNIQHTTFCCKQVLLKANALGLTVWIRRLGREFTATPPSPSICSPMNSCRKTSEAT